MSESQGTNVSTGTVEMTEDQLRAMDAGLVAFLANADQTTEGLVTEALRLIDECTVNHVWKVALDSAGKAYETGHAYLLDRISAAPNFHKAISYPIAERLLMLTDAKGKRVFSVRDVETATGVSRGKLNDMNQASKRKPRPNDGTDAQETPERIAAKNAVKRLENTGQAIMDAVADMNAEERAQVMAKLTEVLDVVEKMDLLRAQAEGNPEGTPEGTPDITPEGTQGTPEGTPEGKPEGTPKPQARGRKAS